MLPLLYSYLMNFNLCYPIQGSRTCTTRYPKSILSVVSKFILFRLNICLTLVILQLFGKIHVSKETLISFLNNGVNSHLTILIGLTLIWSFSSFCYLNYKNFLISGMKTINEPHNKWSVEKIVWFFSISSVNLEPISAK